MQKQNVKRTIFSVISEPQHLLIDAKEASKTMDGVVSLIYSLAWMCDKANQADGTLKYNRPEAFKLLSNVLENIDSYKKTTNKESFEIAKKLLEEVTKNMGIKAKDRTDLDEVQKVRDLNDPNFKAVKDLTKKYFSAKNFDLHNDALITDVVYEGFKSDFSKKPNLKELQKKSIKAQKELITQEAQEMYSAQKNKQNGNHKSVVDFENEIIAKQKEQGIYFEDKFTKLKPFDTKIRTAKDLMSKMDDALETKEGVVNFIYCLAKMCKRAEGVNASLRYNRRDVFNALSKIDRQVVIYENEQFMEAASSAVKLLGITTLTMSATAPNKNELDAVEMYRQLNDPDFKSAKHHTADFYKNKTKEIPNESFVPDVVIMDFKNIFSTRNAWTKIRDRLEDLVSRGKNWFVEPANTNLKNADTTIRPYKGELEKN